MEQSLLEERVLRQTVLAAVCVAQWPAEWNQAGGICNGPLSKFPTDRVRGGEAAAQPGGASNLLCPDAAILFNDAFWKPSRSLPFLFVGHKEEAMNLAIGICAMSVTDTPSKVDAEQVGIPVHTL